MPRLLVVHRLVAATPEERGIWLRGVDRLDSIDFRPARSRGPADIPIAVDRVHDLLADGR